eukprot:267916_1
MIAMLRIAFLAAIAAANKGADVEDHRRTTRRLQCDPQTEQQCTRCSYGPDGAPIPEDYCAPTSAAEEDSSEGCPMTVCCDVRTEETCYDDMTNEAITCARYDEGGCPCPDGQVKCGANEFSSGYCTSLCCDWMVEETCYDENGEPAYCKSYD